MVCLNFGQPERVQVDGIAVHRAHAPDSGIPVLRFVHPKLTSLWAAMARANADVYYQRTCGALTGIVAAFCRSHSRPFVYAAAHDRDFDPALPLIRLYRDRSLYRWGLRRADAIVVQSAEQRESCARTFGLPSRHIPSCYLPPASAASATAGYVLWVSTMRDWKRPELFIELAARLPQLRFRMVGGPDDPGYYEVIRARAAQVPNLEFNGFVPYADIDREFDGARVFVNTSVAEGFPNTFLQSWARGIPAVSFTDPGCVLDGAAVVQVARSIDHMAQLVADLMTNDRSWREIGVTSHEYFSQHHSLESVAAAYESLIEQLL